MTNEIEELNKVHFVAQEGGKTRVYKEYYDEDLKRNVLHTSTFEDFKNYYLNKYIEVEGVKDGKPTIKFVPIGGHWLKDPARRQYNKIIFMPGKAQDPLVYNLWKGFSAQPDNTGSWDLLKAHIHDNICNCNVDSFNYYMNWMTAAIQKPAQPGNVAVVLKGARGTGKGTAIGYFAELFGQHFLQVVSSKQLTGNFNLHLRDAVILFSDEAIYAGNSAEESVLKGLITEKYLAIEGKNRDLIMSPNHLHIMMATNHQWAVPAGTDERRFFVLNVPDIEGVKQNSAYFNPIRLQMDSGGRGAMLHELLQRDISGWDCYAVPKTEGLLEQKIESLDPLHAWWYTKLNEGCIFDGFEWEDAVPTEAVYTDYINHCKNTGRRYNANLTQFGIFINKVNPKGWPGLSRVKPDDYFYDCKLMLSKSKNKKHYAFYELNGCKDIFEKIIGHKINWAIVLQSKKSSQSIRTEEKL
jgi:hypothetical protein